MREGPILFNAPMVRATLDGSKTKTRRLHGLEKLNTEPARWTVEQQGLIDLPGAPYTGKRGVVFRDGLGERFFVSSLYSANTVLWVREAWRLPVTLDEFSGQEVNLRTTLAGGKASDLPIQYEADNARRNWNGDFEPGRYRHSRFMPRWASRTDLQYVGEHVERLQSCSEADAIAEGIEPNWIGDLEFGPNGFGGQGWGRDCGWRHYTNGVDGDPAYTPIESYQSLWESINGAGSWDTNPWVRVIEFRRTQ